jgi:hypothetical protein
MATRKQAGSRRRTRAAKGASIITLRTMIGGAIREQPISASAPIRRVAEEWTYVLRSRSRWSSDDDIRLEVRKRAVHDLKRLGVAEDYLRALASTQHIEVELHDHGNAADRGALYEAAAELPWEYIISAATRGVGRYHSLLITRLLRNGGKAALTSPPKDVLFIESGPGRLEGTYDFGPERRRIAAALGADIHVAGEQAKRVSSRQAPRATMEVCETQDLASLRQHTLNKWDVIHVTAVDTHQAGWVLPELYKELKEKNDKRDGDPKYAEIWEEIVDKEGRIRDGVVLRETNVPERPIAYDRLAAALINPRRPPELVTLNLYYSGARTAREMVRQGARAALGFLDEIDDELAERFFQAFFWAWCRPVDAAPTLSHAIIQAWRSMQDPRLHGTAIVAWMGTSVFEYFKISNAVPPRKSVKPPRQPSKLDHKSMRELLQVQVDVPSSANYSLLHNDRPLLTRLTLTKLVPEPLEDITIEVELNLGSQNYPYRRTLMLLDEPQVDLAGDVKIPLTATLPRALRERVHSTVYVKVACRGRTAWESTERITLIPVDEWVDDTVNNPWLPSFVLPRDPAILKIISSARRFLVGIADDPAAGFDGYQAIDEDARGKRLKTRGVDAQVQAIWTALVNEYRFQYINPPPAYEATNQRLRTPSEILTSNSGTCIDLALLLASCFEYVEIHPVVVLLKGHAFVGYWRSDEAHQDFVEVRHVPAEVPPAGSPMARVANVRLVEAYGWKATPLHYDEIMEYIVAGDLVMLEATYLTGAWSFADAVKEGRANMRSRRELDSMLDVRLARSAVPPVTPLPIIHE